MMILLGASLAADVTVGGAVDVYHTLDLDRPADNDRPAFLYSHDRAGELTVNLALVQASVEEGPVRAAAGLMAGTFPEANQSGELPLLRHVYEARAGFRLAEGVWVDAGLFPSHLGAESAIQLADLTPTRSLLAENSPYYLGGAKLTAEVSDTLTLGATVANGWQTLRQPDGPDGIGGGTQVVWAPRDGVTLNWSTWVGRSGGDAPSTRVFHDVYAVLTSGPVEGVLWVDLGVDGGDPWGGATAIGRVRAHEHLAIGARIEHLRDPRGVVTQGVTLDGASVNLDVIPLPEDDGELPLAMLRFEARAFRSSPEIFADGALNLAFTTSLAAGF